MHNACFFYNDVKMLSCKGGLWSHNLPSPCSMNNSSSSLHTPQKIEKIYLFPSLVFCYWDVRGYCKCQASRALLQGPASSSLCELKRICQEKLQNRITSETQAQFQGAVSILHSKWISIYQNSVYAWTYVFSYFVFYEHNQKLIFLYGCYLKIYNLMQKCGWQISKLCVYVWL